MRGLVEWRSLRLRVKGGDCVVYEYPEDAEVLQAWMDRLDFGYRGQRLAGAASEVFASLLRACRDRGDVRQLLERQGGRRLRGGPHRAREPGLLRPLQALLPLHEPGEQALPPCWRTTPARLGRRPWSAGFRSATPTGSATAWTW